MRSSRAPPAISRSSGFLAGGGEGVVGTSSALASAWITPESLVWEEISCGFIERRQSVYCLPSDFFCCVCSTFLRLNEIILRKMNYLS